MPLKPRLVVWSHSGKETSNGTLLLQNQKPPQCKIACWDQNRWWWIFKWPSFTGQHVFNTCPHKGKLPVWYGCCCAISIMLAIAGSLFQGVWIKVHSNCEKCVSKTITFQSNKPICQREAQVPFVDCKINISAFQAGPFSNHQDSWSFPNTLGLPLNLFSQ